MSLANTQESTRSTEQVAVRATWVPAADLDFIRSYARRDGFGNTSTGTLRFAVVELARRLRAENDTEIKEENHDAAADCA